jgi:hypothetical protein
VPPKICVGIGRDKQMIVREGTRCRQAQHVCHPPIHSYSTELIKERQEDAKTVLSFPQSPSFSHVILHVCYNMMVEAQTKKCATNSTTTPME